MIKELYKRNSTQTVFNFKELFMLSQKTAGNFARNISYAMSVKDLIQIRRGLYVKDKNYDKLEMATKIYKPAYISFETVLQKEGVIFQSYKTVMVASYKSLDIIVDKNKLKFRKLKDSILLNTNGLIRKDNYFAASKERAILDTLYLNKKYHFDNLRDVNWGIIFELVKIYENKNLEKEVERIYKNLNK